jgi:hypothetical protein
MQIHITVDDITFLRLKSAYETDPTLPPDTSFEEWLVLVAMDWVSELEVLNSKSS